MLCLICKYYLNITFLPRSNINRLLNFANVYICFWFSVKTVLLILGSTKYNTKFVFLFVLFYFFISVRYLLKEKNDFFLTEKNLSCERALNFDQWKTFSENYKPMRVWLWLVYKFTENYCRSWLFSEFIQTQRRYLPRQNTYPNLKTTCHIKLKFFLWTKLLEYLLLAKYLISVAVPLGVARQNTFAGKVMWPFQTVIYRFYLSKYTINVPFWLISCFCKKFSSTNTRDLRARKWFKL